MRTRRRRWIGAGLAILALVPMGIAYGATRGTNTDGSRASCLDWATVKDPTTTTSTTWTNVPGLRADELLAENFAVQVSGTFTGSDVQVRVIDTFVGGTFPLAPRSTSIAGSASPRAFSFTWVGTNPAEHQHTFRLQWRVPSGGSATMNAGDLTVLYQGAPTPGAC